MGPEEGLRRGLPGQTVLPTALFCRQTPGVSSFDPSPGVGRPFAGVQVGSPARVRPGSEGSLEVGPLDDQMPGSELLKALSGQMSLDALAWIAPGRDPLVEGRGYGRRALLHCIDWPVLSDLAAGGVVDLRANAYPLSGKMRGFGGYGFMVKSPGGCDGTLVGLSSRPAHGTAAQWMQMARRVSARFVAEEDRRRAETQERESRLGRQTAALNHDLRNHLNLASMQLERLQAEDVSADSESPGVQAGDTVNLDDLSRSLGNARDLCAGTVLGRSELERRRIALRPRLLAQGRAAREMSACGDSIRVLVRCPEGFVVRGHPSHLDRLIKNLMLNAIEASPAGSEIRLGARHLDGHVQLEVLDAGRGMDAAGLEAWMTAGQSGGGGTGYGSASMQECLAGLGADIDVASAPGEGTRVSVRFPVVQSSQRPRVLLVEPSARRRQSYKARLANGDSVVAEAASVEEARTWMGESSLEQVLISRGLQDSGLPSFLAAAQRACLDVQVLSVLGATGPSVPDE